MENQRFVYHIRPAQADEAAQLTTLALQSKAYWGYDQAFMLACRAELTVTPQRIAAQPTYVLEEGGHIQGFYMLDRDRTPLVELDFLRTYAVARLCAAPACGKSRRTALGSVKNCWTAGRMMASLVPKRVVPVSSSC